MDAPGTIVHSTVADGSIQPPGPAVARQQHPVTVHYGVRAEEGSVEDDRHSRVYTSVEICAGAGGQALGLHQAKFKHLALIEIDKDACQTLRTNVAEQEWENCRVLDRDLFTFDVSELGIKSDTLDLLAGGVPCPPFSFAGKQLGRDDERDLFPKMIEMVNILKPRAVMIENVRGLLEPAHKFQDYRENVIEHRLDEAGYHVCDWDVLEARDFGVPQLRPRAILVAFKKEYAHFYPGLPKGGGRITTVLDALQDSMLERVHGLEDQFPGREDLHADAMEVFQKWRARADQCTVAPTLVGGSRKHGGADLGPTRAKLAWAKLGVDAHGVANAIGEVADIERDFFRPLGPMLTVEQAKLIQGFPSEWKFSGRKTAAYRQAGNAFPPPVAKAVGLSIIRALRAVDSATDPSPPVDAPALRRRSARQQLLPAH